MKVAPFARACAKSDEAGGGQRTGRRDVGPGVLSNTQLVECGTKLGQQHHIPGAPLVPAQHHPSNVETSWTAVGAGPSGDQPRHLASLAPMAVWQEARAAAKAGRRKGRKTVFRAVLLAAALGVVLTYSAVKPNAFWPSRCAFRVSS